MSLGVAVTVAALVFGASVAWAAFSSQAASQANTFSAAAEFDGGWIASGSYTGNGSDNRSITGVGFQPDLVMIKDIQNRVAIVRTSTMVGDTSKDMASGSGAQANSIQALLADGFQVGTDVQVNQSGRTFHWVAFKAVAGRMVLGSYTGNGADNRQINVGLGPDELWLIPQASQPVTERSDQMSSPYRFDSNSANTDGITALGATGFTVGDHVQANQNGQTYHYVAWKAQAGKVSVGSYTGNGADNRQITAPGYQPTLVMVRRSISSTQPVFRPGSLAGDASLPYTGGSVTTNQIQALTANGFQLGTSANVNSSGSTYYYQAFGG